MHANMPRNMNMYGCMVYKGQKKHWKTKNKKMFPLTWQSTKSLVCILIHLYYSTGPQKLPFEVRIF